MLTLQTWGHFTWDYGMRFHIETIHGYFEWSDPDYGGDNTIIPCGTYAEWLSKHNLQFGRDKGYHMIGDYCGPDVIIKE